MRASWEQYGMVAVAADKVEVVPGAQVGIFGMMNMSLVEERRPAKAKAMAT